MLELATLGLLQGEPLHGYRLKQQLELFMSGCISVNYGAIYPLLKRLQERGYIQVLTEENEGSGPSRKIYCITKQGKARWKEKMLNHPQESWVHSRSRFMVKFVFFSYLTREERIKLLEHRLMVCRLRLENQDIDILPPDPYLFSAWSRCQATTQNEIHWLEATISLEMSNFEEKKLNQHLPSELSLSRK
jgi:DNA-binding PadR family transcriptional regulator